MFAAAIIVESPVYRGAREHAEHGIDCCLEAAQEAHLIVDGIVRNNLVIVRVDAKRVEVAI